MLGFIADNARSSDQHRVNIQLENRTRREKIIPLVVTMSLGTTHVRDGYFTRAVTSIYEERIATYVHVIPALG